MESKETSGSATALVLRHVRTQGGDAAVAEVLRRADVGLPLGWLEDPTRWISHDTHVRIFEAADAVLPGPRPLFAVGEAAMRDRLSTSRALLVRAMGSPSAVFRQLPRRVGRFSTTTSVQVVRAGSTFATVQLRVHEGHRPCRPDCDYAQGWLTSLPTLFGLPPAEVQHAQCQVDGHPACSFHVTFERAGRRLPWRRDRPARASVELAALRGQLEALQLSAADVVDSDGLGSILQRIIERAATAVFAPGYVLAVASPDGGRPLVHAVGVPPRVADRMAPALLAGDDLGDDIVVVDVESSRRRHGRLAALYEGYPPDRPGDRAVLQAYARHAAAAIDLRTALEDSRLGEQRARGLLDLAHQLATTTDAVEVAEYVCDAVAAIVGRQANAVLFWDAGRGALRTVATAGLSPYEADILTSTHIRADEVPELVKVLATHRPVEITASTASPMLAQLLQAIGIHDLVAVPLLEGDTLLGVVTAAHRAHDATDATSDALERLQGVADQAATALGKAQLLSTVRHQSLHDSLTGLPNRVLFTDLLEQSLRVLGGEDGVAVLFCDLDRFKQVNDGLGHQAGDELLRQVAARLRGAVRPTDTVGRLSGDEFAVLLAGVTDAEVAAELARRIITCFDQPFRLDGREQRITTSVGVALHTGPDGRGDRLLRAADGAMYDAKQRGRNQISTAGEVRQTNKALLSLEAELAAAVTGDQLRLHFQPVVESDEQPRHAGDPAGRGLRVVGAEALVRWEHPRLGLLSPAAFLPLAEESGLVVEVDLWALRAACVALAGWAVPGEPPLHVAVNLAAQTLLDVRLLAAVRASLTSQGIAPERLHLEVVESRSLANLPGVIERLTELRQLGVRVSLDDFGTGYSTLAWLQQLPVDQIKIDRTFIAALPDDDASMAVVRGMLALARELGIQVVAEGVEDARQLTALRDAGCDLLQGYLLGRPSPGAPMLQVATTHPA